MNRLGGLVERARYRDLLPGERHGLLLVIELIDGLVGGVVQHVRGAHLDAVDRTLLGVGSGWLPIGAQ